MKKCVSVCVCVGGGATAGVSLGIQQTLTSETGKANILIQNQELITKKVSITKYACTVSNSNGQLNASFFKIRIAVLDYKYYLDVKFCKISDYRCSTSMATQSVPRTHGTVAIFGVDNSCVLIVKLVRLYQPIRLYFFVIHFKVAVRWEK